MRQSQFKQSRHLGCLFAIAVGLLAGGCDATQQLQAVSAGQTGCAPQEIEISNDQGDLGTRSWVAWCRSKPYQCSAAGNSVSCRPMHDETPPPLARTAEPASPPPKRQTSSWVKHQLRDCSVSAEFPAEPKDATNAVQTKEGPSKITIAQFELPGGKGAMSAACSSAVATKKGTTATTLDGARDGMLKNIGAKLTKEREIIGGREVLFELQGEQGLAHILWASNRLIVVTVFPVAAFGPDSAKRFVNSVQMVAEP